MKKWYERLTDEQIQQLKDNQVPPGLIQSKELVDALEDMPNTDRQWWNGDYWVDDMESEFDRHSSTAYRLRPDWERPLMNPVFREFPSGKVMVGNADLVAIRTSAGKYVCNTPRCLEEEGVRTDWAEWDEQGRFVKLTDKCDFEVPDVLRPKLRRVRIGQPKTVGEMWNMLHGWEDSSPLTLENGTLPTFYYTMLDGQDWECIEIEVDRNEPG